MCGNPQTDMTWLPSLSFSFSSTSSFSSLRRKDCGAFVVRIVQLCRRRAFHLGELIRVLALAFVMLLVVAV